MADSIGRWPHVGELWLCASSAAVSNLRRVHHVLASLYGHRTRKRRMGRRSEHLLRVVVRSDIVRVVITVAS